MPPLEAHELGLYARSYDAIHENSQEDTNKQKIAHVLAWLKSRSAKEQEKNRKKNDSKGNELLRELIDAGIELERFNSVAAIAALKASSHRGPLLDAAVQIIGELYVSFENVLAGSRVKTSLVIVLAIGVGGALGFVLGTFILPGVALFIGGAIGSWIVMGLTAIGGGIGLGIMSAVSGIWGGIKISKSYFRHERKFELPKWVTRQLQEENNIDPRLATRINGYLYNRSKVVKSALLKKYYKILRRLMLKEVDSAAVEEVARFFCHELRLLRQELTPYDPIKYNEEINAVVEILEGLERARGVSEETCDEIGAMIGQSVTNERMVPDLTFSRSELLRKYPRINARLAHLSDQARAFSETIDDKKIAIYAEDKDSLAMLYAAACIAGLKPDFPTGSDSAQRKEIIEKGERLVRGYRKPQNRK